jgi:hypothetical protein
MKANFDLTSGKELDARTNDGVEVRLLWHPTSNCVAVEVVDSRTCEQFALAVHAADALDAFHHPFAYAARDELSRAATAELRAAEIDTEPISLHTR